MHGLGADGHDFVPMAQALNLPQTKWVLPHAPDRAITIYRGMLMPGWFDILSLDRIDPEDVHGLQTSRWQIRALIEAERMAGFHYEDIFVGGFSQGGVMALYTGLSYEKPLGGIMALSCYLPLQKTFEAWATPDNKATRIFMAHGHYDPVLPIHLAQVGHEFLTEQEYAIDWHEYPTGHQLCEEEVQDLKNYLRTDAYSLGQ
jgi:phospholipase/carboxylesterase